MPRLPLVIIAVSLIANATANVARAQSDQPVGNDRIGLQQSPPVQEKGSKSGGSIKGRVIGEGSRGVADASIMAFPINIASNMQAMVTSLFRPVNTDADGKFELSGLQAGAYNISANAPGYVLSDSDAKPFYRPGDTVTLTLVKGGVITGKVTNSSGDPLVGVIVRAIKVREGDNKPVRIHRDISSEFIDSMSSMLGPYKTDDRGIYRIYGLTAGYYQVAAGGGGGRGFSLGSTGAYDNDAPTYYPSGTLYTAAEVTVHAGDEITNIDIRYRDNRGHSITGTVSGAKGSSQQGISVVLARASTGIVEATTFVFPSTSERAFVFDATLDGDYFVTATAGSGAMLEGPEGMNVLVSPSRRATVSGADVTGIDLPLEPLGSIAGRAVFEPVSDTTQKPDCKPTRRARLEELVITSQSEGKRQPEDQAAALLSIFKDTTPNDKGDFVISFLRPAVHHVDIQLPTEQLYIKSVVLPLATPNGNPVDAAKSGVLMKSGEKVKGLVVTISEGASGLRGRVVTGEAGKPPTSKMRVHLVPAEPEAADDVLRYFENEVAADGAFSLTNLAPGKYWLVGRELSDEEQGEVDHKPLAWDAGGRVGLRFEGEATKKVITLTQCQRVEDFRLNYAPLIKPSKQPSKKSTLDRLRIPQQSQATLLSSLRFLIEARCLTLPVPSTKS